MLIFFGHSFFGFCVAVCSFPRSQLLEVSYSRDLLSLYFWTGLFAWPLWFRGAFLLRAAVLRTYPRPSFAPPSCFSCSLRLLRSPFRSIPLSAYSFFWLCSAFCSAAPFLMGLPGSLGCALFPTCSYPFFLFWLRFSAQVIPSRPPGSLCFLHYVALFFTAIPRLSLSHGLSPFHDRRIFSPFFAATLPPSASSQALEPMCVLLLLPLPFLRGCSFPWMVSSFLNPPIVHFIFFRFLTSSILHCLFFCPLCLYFLLIFALPCYLLSGRSSSF